MELYTLQRTDSALLRDVLLRMYADTPDAFGETLAQAQARTDTEWDGMAEMVSDPTRFVAFAARQDKRTVGFVVGLLGRVSDDGELDFSFTDTVTAGRMWVDPSVRRQGVGHLLLNAVIDWARAKGAKQVELSVTKTNDSAIRFYQREGFSDTGERAPFPPNPSLQIYHMVRTL